MNFALKLLFKFVTPDKLALYVRHGLSGLGAVAVAHGVATNDQSQAVIGGVAALAAIAWSFAQKEAQKKAVQVALQTPAPPAPPIIDPVKAGLM